MSATNSSNVMESIRLPLHPIKQQGESVVGHAFRTAMLNGVSGRALTKKVRPPHRFGLTKFCPYCLKDEPIFKSEWEDANAMWCDKHECWLMDSCSACKQALRWQREKLLHCRCGHALTRNVPPPIKDVQLNELHWLKGKKPTPLKAPKLNVKDRLATIMLLGSYSVTDGLNIPTHKRHGSEVEAKRPLVMAGLALIRNWPNSYHDFLDDLYWRSVCALPKTRESRLFKSYGRKLSEQLKTTNDGELISKYQSVFEQYTKRTLNKRHRAVKPVVVNQNRWMTVKQASKELGLAKSAIYRLVEKGLLRQHAKLTPKSRTFNLIEKSSVADFVGQFGELLNTTSATKYLGITKKQFRDLRHTKSVNSLLQTDDKCVAQYFAKKELDKLWGHWKEKNFRATPDDTVSFSWATKYIQLPRTCRLLLLFKAINKGKLAVYRDRSGEQGLRQFCLSKKEVLLWSKEFRQQAASAQKGSRHAH